MPAPMTDRAMPAATSFEDIYQISSSCTSLSSAPPYLTDYHMMFHLEPPTSIQSFESRVFSTRQELSRCQAKQNSFDTYQHHRNYNNNQQQPYLTSYDANQSEDDICDSSSSIFMMFDDNLSTTSSSAPKFLSMTPPPSSTITTTQHYLTIEELKSARTSCWLCGCNWQQDHVSLDCPECGGYALTRPCPNCDGKCKQTWKRNIGGTHDHHKAIWVGQCSMHNSKSSAGENGTANLVAGDIGQGEAAAPGADSEPRSQPQPDLQAQVQASNSQSSCCSSAHSSDSELETRLDNGAAPGHGPCTMHQQQPPAAKSQQQQQPPPPPAEPHPHQSHICVCN